MIPYLLAAVGGYLLGNSMKESQSYAHGGILDNADIEVEMESMNSNTLVLEVEIYDGTKETKYFFEYSVDHSDNSCSLDAIYDENNNKVSKELQTELESNKSLDNQLDNAIRDAFDKYADERYESRRDYEEE